MFLGQFSHSLDSKNRLTIPSRYRELLGEGAYMVQGFDGNLSVYPTSTYERLAEQAQQLNETDPETRLFKRLFFARASWVDVDKAGRILIPDFLRQHADVQTEVVLAGVNDHFEIWSPGRWDAQTTSLEDPGIAQRFSDLNLSAGQ